MIEKAYTQKLMEAKCSDVETHYANIERELLGVVGGLEKFHYFTFGHPVQVLTDHKPLISCECTTRATMFTVTPE